MTYPLTIPITGSPVSVAGFAKPAVDAITDLDKRVKTLEPGDAIPASNDQPSEVTTSSTGFVANASVCGTGFTAPLSGRVVVMWAAVIRATSGAGFGVCSYELRTGSDVGSGAVVVAPSLDRGCQNSGTSTVASSTFHCVTGLTPGDTYNVQLMYASQTGTTSGFARRRLLIIPIP
ncbi:hypothetical protein [Rhizomonospora bruguierae]|uniref:hypothetical protein n=1 Tax=Rhizomonospora bruguierae TaxID=1581705 RepID=UPI001BCC2E27|nr:hypothetical protein [Micromonospora sp. NBRC 107566]